MHGNVLFVMCQKEYKIKIRKSTSQIVMWIPKLGHFILAINWGLTADIQAELVLYCNFMMFYDVESNVIISRGIIKQFHGSNDVKILEMLLTVIGNLLIQCIEEKKYDETKFLVRAANQISTKPELFFYKNVIVLLENMIMYQYDAKDKYLQICHKAIENFSLLGMPEYGKEITRFFEKQK